LNKVSAERSAAKTQTLQEIMDNVPKRLVIFGVSNILSDLFDCALANGLALGKVVVHHPEQIGKRDVALTDRLAALEPRYAPPVVESLEDFLPQAGEAYLLGPTTPTRRALAKELHARFGLAFHRLVHPTAYVSPLAKLAPGVFVGANSVIAPGAELGAHVFVNRGVTIGHDTRIGAYSRIQPGSNLGGLSRIGEGVTIGIGATVVERLAVGDNAVIGAGAVVLEDIPANVLVAGTPATVKRTIAPAGG
jgi:sugar O-acyltransferase (sialic acid O-acetyltransferase NeuD family)